MWPIAEATTNFVEIVKQIESKCKFKTLTRCAFYGHKV